MYSKTASKRTSARKLTDISGFDYSQVQLNTLAWEMSKVFAEAERI